MNNLKKILIDRGIAQETIATHLGISVRTLQRFIAEEGECHPFVMMRNLCRDLKVSADYLVGLRSTNELVSFHRHSFDAGLFRGLSNDHMLDLEFAQRFIRRLDARLSAMGVTGVQLVIVDDLFDAWNVSPWAPIIEREAMALYGMRDQWMS